MSYKILSGIRIIDLTMVFAGPVATKIMAELGAEVIKVESEQRADVFTRANVYPENNPGEDPWNRGCLFHTLNLGKRGISLNLASDKGREILKQLVAKSDAIIENFSPRVMDNWGLSYEELCKINPNITMVSISGLGHHGPLRDYYMYVPGMEGMSGLTYNTGFPDSPPLLSGYAYGDWVTGVNAAMALITALYYKKKTGKGQYIDISGREASVCHLGDIVMDFTMNKRERTRRGNTHSSFAPHGCYRCKGDDNWVTVAVENDEQWSSFCQIMGNPGWTKSEKFTSLKCRLDNQAELDLLIEKWTAQYDKFEIMELLQKCKVAAGVVSNMKEVNLNPHLIEREFFQQIDHGEDIGNRPIPAQLPAKFTGFEQFTSKRAPHFGEDTEYVILSLLGMSREYLAQLEEEKVISSQPTFPRGRPTRIDLIEQQQAGWFDPDYLDELRKTYGNDIGTPVDKKTEIDS
jgi:crotonobetainyl-CoA:carnitine CoA-transferase CaiB-like acyl-CoA transferase